MSMIDVREPSDAQLIAASRFDSVHFATVLDRHAAAVLGYLDRRLGMSSSVNHVPEVFASAYGSRRHFRSWNDSARPWFLGVATGVVRKQWRTEQVQLRGLARDVAPFAAGVAEHLQHLDARDRDVVLLAAWEDLEPAAIAMALDLPAGTVAARLDGLDRHLLARLQGRPGPDGSAVVTSGLDLVRALRPATAAPEPRLVAVGHELRAVTGQRVPDRARITSEVAATHEQLRRWRARPGAAIAALRARSSSPTGS